MKYIFQISVFIFLIFFASHTVSIAGPSYLNHILQPIAVSKAGILLFGSKAINPMGTGPYVPTPIHYFWVFVQLDGKMKQFHFLSFDPDYRDWKNITILKKNFNMVLQKVKKLEYIPKSLQKYRWKYITKQKQYSGLLSKYLKLNHPKHATIKQVYVMGFGGYTKHMPSAHKVNIFFAYKNILICKNSYTAKQATGTTQQTGARFSVNKQYDTWIIDGVIILLDKN